MLAWLRKPIFSGLKMKSPSSKAIPALLKAKLGQLPKYRSESCEYASANTTRPFRNRLSDPRLELTQT
jgi:hypothetical protein